MPSKRRSGTRQKRLAGHESEPEETAVEEGVELPVVGIGASAGGLEALKQFLDGLPADTGMAFVLVQHLHPERESLTAELLAKHTGMDVAEAADRDRVRANHVYVIPSNRYLSIREGRLHLREPMAQRGRRMPIDHFLRSLAEERQDQAIGILLSGTGTDGTLGLKAIKGHGGITLAQDPATAGYPGMVRSAMDAGLVDYVLPAERMGEALLDYVRRAPRIRRRADDCPDEAALGNVLGLLHRHAGYDFRAYKQGTLLRRISRRMALNQIHGLADYAAFLRSNADEIQALLRDLLISVTAFFREPDAFRVLADKVLGPIIREKSGDEPIRVWVPGCATGEEVYSLAILLAEQLEQAGKDCPVRIFGTDIDQRALEIARAGVYPESIAEDLSPERLRRHFVREDSHFRLVKSIREVVTFAPQNLVSDPPFSRLDLVSCRNVMIYLQPDLQRRVLALFHFALAEGGYLFLGESETVGTQGGLFEEVDKKWRLYRRLSVSNRHLVDFPLLSSAYAANDLAQPRTPAEHRGKEGPARVAEVAQQLLLEAFAPAAVLVNRAHQVQYYYGPTDRFLTRPAGAPTEDLLAQAREGLGVKLRTALHRAADEGQRVTVSGGYVRREDGSPTPVRITVQPSKSLRAEGTGRDPGLLLVAFEEEKGEQATAHLADQFGKATRDAVVRQLEDELKSTREDLQSTIEGMESANEELKSANEEIMSMNEELQSANEELESSKEELQSMNEELTTVNSQLQSKLEELENLNDDLKNLLASTDIATLFLDRGLNIKRFTPATRRLFNVIATDVGRPVSDICHQLDDGRLVADAEAVLKSLQPREPEVTAADGRCYQQRLLPYRTEDDRIDGVVATFVDITDRKRMEEDLREAKAVAEAATDQKSHFLAAASHDIRQPLQALSLTAAELLKHTEDPRRRELLERQQRTVEVATGLLDRLLDLTQLDAGAVTPTFSDFPVSELLDQVEREYEPLAEHKGIELRVRRGRGGIRSDRELLARIVDNFVSNAIRYSDGGKILVGCRRQDGAVRIEVWDQGRGIHQEELERIFTEFYRLPEESGGQDRGIGLGLAIVKRLAGLLGHPIRVRSKPRRGSVFTILVPKTGSSDGAAPASSRDEAGEGSAGDTRAELPLQPLLIEDDGQVARSLEMFLRTAGFRPILAADGETALDQVRSGRVRPDLILANYRMPEGHSGLELIRRIRELLGAQVPAMLLTGDTGVPRPEDIGEPACDLVYKPVAGRELVRRIRRLLRRDRRRG